MKTVSLILYRKEEEYYLQNCNNTCISGMKCKCKTDFLTDLSGMSLSKWGSPYCILCLRHAATSNYIENDTNNNKRLNYYSNIYSEYQESCYIEVPHKVTGCYNGINGPFIKYSTKDYKRDDLNPNSIVQLFKDSCSNSWITNVYSIDNTTEIKSLKSDIWDLCYCSNNLCKLQLLSFKDTWCAIGIDNTEYNLGLDQIVCLKCNHQVTFISSNPETNLVNLNNKYLTRCYFCKTLIEFMKCTTFQCCVDCTVKNSEDNLVSTRICARCNNSISSSKRGGGIHVYKILKGDSQIYEIYLCRQHKLKKYDVHKVFTEQEFNELIT